MVSVRKNTGSRKKFFWQIQKHYRWFRRSFYRNYLKRVRITEREIGGEIQAC